MNKFVIYIFLVISYLVLAKSLSPSEFGINYVQNEKSLSELVKGSPVSVILVDIHNTGFIIKTYYHKYKLVYGFQSYEEMIVRTSGIFNEKHKNNIGMAIFRRGEDQSEDYAVLPPGSMFVGDRHFGYWKLIPSGERVWEFYRVYRTIPEFLGWGEWRPTSEFVSQMKAHTSQEKPFYGLKNEFGIGGIVTKQNFPNYFEKQAPKEINLKHFFLDYFKENFYNTRKNYE